MPQDRAAALRKAFMDTMKDKTFLAEADKAKLEITPLGGDAVQKIIAEVAKTNPAVLKKAAAMVQVESQKKSNAATRSRRSAAVAVGMPATRSGRPECASDRARRVP